MKLTEGFTLLATAPDGIKRLRKLILSLAVQGQLAPQDPTDEPASELLKQIRVESDRPIAEGKIKADKPPPAIADAEKPFELPVGWAWARLGDVGSTFIGLTYSPSNVSDTNTGIPVLRSSNLQKGKIDLSDLVRVNIAVKPQLIVEDGDLLICARNGSKALVGKAAIIRNLNEPMTFGAFMAIYKSRLNQFVEIFIQSPIFRGMLDDISTTTINQITQKNLKTTVIAIPPLAEQSRIVAKVEELMALCDELETRGKLEAEQHARLTATLFDALAASESAHQLQENWARLASNFDLILDRPEAVDALERTLLQLAVRGLLVERDPEDEPASELLKQIRAEKDQLLAEGKIKKDKPLPVITDEEKPFELPRGWEWARFAEVADIASNLVNPAQYLNFQQVAPDSIEKHSGQLISRRTVSEAGVTSSNHLFTAGQILYSKIRPSLSKAVIVDFDGLCSADMYPINSRIAAEYLHHFILSQVFLDQVRVAENRVKMPKLNQEALNSFIIAVPPLAEQSRIVARIEALRALCAGLRGRLAASQKIQTHLAGTLVESTSND
jgi:type I restriction enzyme S subunit